VLTLVDSFSESASTKSAAEYGAEEFSKPQVSENRVKVCAAENVFRRVALVKSRMTERIVLLSFIIV
jgi:hypothetical protein